MGSGRKAIDHMILKGFSPITTALRRIAEVVWELPRDAVPKGGEDPSKVRMRSDLEVFQDVHRIRCVEEENPGIQLKQRNGIFFYFIYFPPPLLVSLPFKCPTIKVHFLCFNGLRQWESKVS